MALAHQHLKSRKGEVKFYEAVAPMIVKLLKSAVANADQKKTIDVDTLYVKHISVDQGPTLKRYMPRAMGRASEIKKKTSHINLVLEER